MAIRISGSPRTAARQLVELLTRDNILDEDGNVNEATVEAACRYVGGQRTLDEWAEPPLTVPTGELYQEATGETGFVDGKFWSGPPPSPRSLATTAGSSPSRKNETPEPISEQCTQEALAPRADTSRSNNSEQDASTTDNHGPSLQERQTSVAVPRAVP